jgi:tellurite resistance protein
MSAMTDSVPSALAGFDEPKLEALIETMFLAAFADGDFGDEERAHFVKSIESLSDARLGAAKVDALVAKIEKQLAATGREARLADVKARLPDAGARKVALSLAIQIAASDGIIRTSERELILEAAEALGIDRGEAADLVKKVASG